MFRSVKKNLIAMIILTMLGGFAVSVNAAFNEQINFQGKLTNSSNLSVADGNNCMKFSLYTASAGGSSIWSEEWKASTSYIVTTSGLFSVLLGSNTVLSSVNFNQSALYLQVEYDPACDGTYEESFSPRKLFGAVPAAFEAKKLAGYTWATPDAIGTSTPSTGAFTTLFAGIGAINPLAKLHVEGQCVTGDTMLRRRRRKLKSQISNFKTTTQNLKPNETEDENYIYDDVMIKDVKPGDEIQTLDENTGKLVWSKVNALMDMGVKQIYKLTTASGKTIRTTGNHPYLVMSANGRLTKHPSIINGAGWIAAENMKEGDYVAELKPKVGVFIDDANMFYAQRKKKWKVDYEKLAALLKKDFQVEFMNYYIAIPKESDEPAYSKTQKYLKKIEGKVNVITKPLKYIFERISFNDGGEIERVVRKGNFDVEITRDALDNLDSIIIVSGDSDFVGLRDDVWKKKKQILFLAFKDNLAIELKQGKYFTFEKMRKLVELGQKNTPELFGGTLLSLVYSNQGMLSIGGGNDSDFVWTMVDKIEQKEIEQVYDIEVEETHNFIGNGIVAHNTYINGNLGIGTTGPDAKLDSLATTGAQLRLTYADGTVYSDFTTNATGDLTIGASSGNVFFPKLIGGAATTTDLYLQTTTGIGTTGADMHFLVGSNGATEAMTILNSGYVGVGATNPLAKLHIEGQCVTGDTKLRRRRRKLKTTTQDLKPNETVDENTGKLVWSKVNALMDMGVKQIFELKTEDGKTIRTTGNHPYLAVQKGAEFPETKKAGSESPALLVVSGKNQDSSPKNYFYYSKASNPVNSCFQNNLKQPRWTGRDSNPQFLGDNQVFCRLKLPAPAETATLLYQNEVEKENNISNVENVVFDFLYENKSLLETHFYYNQSSELVKPKWVKVVYLSVGDELAVASDDFQTVKFVKIKEINIMPAEQVYDIEVEGTHNFIGNGIVAHNTYIN